MNGGRRKDSSIRAANAAEIEYYAEAWDLLEQPADYAPIVLPEWVYERACGDIGLPDGHPGGCLRTVTPRWSSAARARRTSTRC